MLACDYDCVYALSVSSDIFMSQELIFIYLYMLLLFLNPSLFSNYLISEMLYYYYYYYYNSKHCVIVIVLLFFVFIYSSD